MYYATRLQVPLPDRPLLNEYDIAEAMAKGTWTEDEIAETVREVGAQRGWLLTEDRVAWAVDTALSLREDRQKRRASPWHVARHLTALGATIPEIERALARNEEGRRLPNTAAAIHRCAAQAYAQNGTYRDWDVLDRPNACDMQQVVAVEDMLDLCEFFNVTIRIVGDPPELRFSRPIAKYGSLARSLSAMKPAIVQWALGRGEETL